jgi:hypothetical protein
MTPGDLVAALAIPTAAVVDQKVTKKLLIENGSPTAADKRRITEGVSEVRWVAALKPSTVGIAPYADATREYVEIAVLTARLNAGAKGPRLSELIHRAIPYPVLLITSEAGCSTSLSVVHKRWSIAETNKVVLDGEPLAVEVVDPDDSECGIAFHAALAISARAHANLLVLYQWWIDVICALQAAARTGRFVMLTSAQTADRRRIALAACDAIEAKIATTRMAAAKITQMSQRVELNLQLQQLRADLAAALANI